MANTKSVTLKEQKWESLVVMVEGLEPGLMTHQFPIEKPPSAPKEPTDDWFREEAGRGLYMLDPPREGAMYGLPAIAFRSAMSAAAKGSGHKKLNGVNVLRVVRIPLQPDELLPIQTDACREPTGPGLIEVPEQPYWARVSRVVISKAAVRKARPLFPAGWRVAVPIECHSDIAEQDLVALLNRAGDCIGVGDYRPERQGWFGRFKVVGDE